MASRRGPDNSVRIAISGSQNSVNWANVFHAQLTTSSAITQTDLDTWTTSFQAQYKTSFSGHQVANATYILAKAVLYTPGGGQLTSAVAMTGAGVEAGTAVADDSVAKVVSWLSTVYWRGGKPRTYLPGCPTADVLNNVQLTAASVSALATSAGAFRTAINVLAPGTITGTKLGFVSFRTGNADRVPAVFYEYTGARVHPRLGTQRRRLGKWLN